MADRIEDKYTIPRKSKENINVLLKKFKDGVVARQAGAEVGGKKVSLNKLQTMIKAKKQSEENKNVQKTNVFNNLMQSLLKIQRR